MLSFFCGCLNGNQNSPIKDCKRHSVQLFNQFINKSFSLRCENAATVFACWQNIYFLPHSCSSSSGGSSMLAAYWTHQKM